MMIRFSLLPILLFAAACGPELGDTAETDSAATLRRVDDTIGVVPTPTMRCLMDAFCNAPSDMRLLIITSSELEDSLKPLVNHKNATNMPAFILTVDKLRPFFIGDDDPEKIKRAIHAAYDRFGIDYVMLAGDASHVPVRHRFVRQLLSAIDNPCRWLDGTYNPSDLYYANLFRDHHNPSTPNGAIVHLGQFSDWDYNNDGKYNDQLWQNGMTSVTFNPDQVSGFPDIAVGRVPARDSAEMDLFVDKIIDYENAAPWNNFYRQFAFFADKNYPTATDLSEYMRDALTDPTLFKNEIGLDYDTYDPIPAGWIKGNTSTINAFSNLSVWMTYVGHGHSTGWGAVNFFDSFLAQFILSNTDRQPVVYAAACDTGQFALNIPFGRYQDVNGVIHNYSQPSYCGASITDHAQNITQPTPFYVPKPSPYDFDNAPARSFASAWLFNEEGAVAYFGETVTMPNGAGTELGRRMLERYQFGDRILGDIYQRGQIKYWRDYQGQGDVFNEPRIYLGIMTFFGDPSLRLK